MDEPLRFGSVEVPASELSWRFSRSSGPGGQSVNTADSRVEVSFDVARSNALPPRLRERALERLEGRLVDGVLTVAATEHRSQWRNRRVAVSRLSEILETAVAPPPRRRRPTRPSRGAMERRRAARQKRSDTKKLRQRPSDG